MAKGMLSEKDGNAVLDFTLQNGARVHFEWRDRDSVRGKFFAEGKPDEPVTQATMKRVAN